MNLTKLATTLFLLMSICHAREPSLVIDLYPDDAPGLLAGGKEEVIVNERIRHVSKPQMLVWFPKNHPASNTPATTLIICPGGGYYHLAMNLHAGSVVEYFNKLGITVIGLKYRTRYGKNDAAADALADGKRAMRIVRSKAKEWNLNPNRIGIQGYSAGANLCLNLAGNFDKGSPKSPDPIERHSSRPNFISLMCPWPNGKTLAAYPIKKDAPPTFIAHARDDKTAPFTFGKGISDKLQKAGISTKLYITESGGHSAFHYGVSQPPGANWPDVFTPWLFSIKMLDKK